MHSVPSTYLRHAPAPSQVPSGPQVDALSAGHCKGLLGFAPEGTRLHSPRAIGRLQALQVSVQAVAQHTPSTQNPVRHSLSQVQASAFPLDFAPASVEHTPGRSAGRSASDASGCPASAPSVALASEPPTPVSRRFPVCDLQPPTPSTTTQARARIRPGGASRFLFHHRLAFR